MLLLLLVGLATTVTSYSLPPGKPFSVRTVSRIQNGNRFGHHYTRQSNHERLSDFPLKAHSATVAAATGLVVSSICGTVADRTVLPNAGILATLLAGGVLSSVGLVPSAHALYDLCWSIFLPGSLALLLLGSNETSQKLSSYRSIAAVCVPFIIGALASLAGCFTAFSICKVFPHVQWILSPKDAAMAGSCLCASFVGGSVNFFAAARIIRADPTLLSAMAAADIFTMAIYFAWLASAIKDEKLLQRFRSNETIPESLTDHPAQEDTIRLRTKVLGGVLVTLLAYLVTVSANSVERVLARVVPGTACAVIALVCPFLRQRASSISNESSGGRMWRAMRHSATTLSAFCFQLFFASIGASASVGQALRFGPGSLLFSAVALTLHVVFLLLGSFMVQKIWKNPSFELKHILVASNALIGGPATAAAYAGQYKTGLTMAATFWGVVGYAIGTNVGVGTARLLRSFL